MKKNSPLSKILLYQNLGFLCVITIGYLDELLKLPALIFSDHPFVLLHRRTTLEMLLFLAIWLLVSSSTRHLLKRIRELEDFLRVCSWCRRINYKGNWIQLEDFMEQGFDTPTTHGICPECLTQQKEALERSKAARKNAAAAG
ncbi:MAG TPA: hypothetical protein VHG71_13485 [Verrucomicrobiae bacterium]|nr:hypothetical protein [Verrucomicrobiae bacterium]